MNNSRILVVEDDSAVRNLIVTTLDTNNYRYLTAPNGKTAVMEAASHNPDIILLDLGLPDMDGVEIIRKIRTWSDVPIIVISARSEDTDKIEALDSGADDYLTKPFSVDELLARIRVTQRRILGMQKISSVFVNGDLTIDYAAGSVTMHQEEIHLTPIEYKILCLLAKNVGTFEHPYLEGVMPKLPYPLELCCAGVWHSTEEKIDVLKSLGFHDFDFYQTLLKNPMYTNEEVEEVASGYRSGGYVAIIAHK